MQHFRPPKNNRAISCIVTARSQTNDWDGIRHDFVNFYLRDLVICWQSRTSKQRWKPTRFERQTFESLCVQFTNTDSKNGQASGQIDKKEMIQTFINIFLVKQNFWANLRYLILQKDHIVHVPSLLSKISLGPDLKLIIAFVHVSDVSCNTSQIGNVVVLFLSFVTNPRWCVYLLYDLSNTEGLKTAGKCNKTHYNIQAVKLPRQNLLRTILPDAVQKKLNGYGIKQMPFTKKTQ